MTEHAIIIPLIIILLAFFFLEKYDQNANFLKSLKDLFGHVQSSQISEEEELRAENSLPEEEHVHHKVTRKQHHKKKSVHGRKSLVGNDTSTDGYAKVKQHDYPLHSSVYRQTNHYIPETKHSDDLEVTLNPELSHHKLSGYQQKDYYTYFFGKHFDHLYS